MNLHSDPQVNYTTSFFDAGLIEHEGVIQRGFAEMIVAAGGTSVTRPHVDYKD